MNEFVLNDEIREENVAQAINFLKANKGDVVLNIDSVGGDVFAGLRLCQAIQSHQGKVIAKCGVVVASIASVIALSCDEMKITKDTFFMVHEAWASAQGTAKELMSTATLLEQASARIKEMVADKAKDKDVVDEWFTKDTWFGYQEILDNFDNASLTYLDTIINSKNLSAYAKLNNKPESLKKLVAKLQNQDSTYVEDVLARAEALLSNQ